MPFPDWATGLQDVMLLDRTANDPNDACTSGRCKVLRNDYISEYLASTRFSFAHAAGVNLHDLGSTGTALFCRTYFARDVPTYAGTMVGDSGVDPAARDKYLLQGRF